MEPVYLKQQVSFKPEGALNDVNSPFSFLEWKQRRPSSVEKDSSFHYNRYLIEWFSNNKGKQISSKFLLRQKYLYLLDQLQLFFTTDEKNKWYETVNLADEKELLLAIPYFAKKLKAIALYYFNLRKRLKNAKLKYNMAGTAFGVEQELYNYLLEVFSTTNSELPPNIRSTIPDLSAIKDSINIEIQELYDDKQYFDRSPTVPLSGYFDLLHQPTEKFFQTKGITLSSSEWLFNSLSLEPTLDLETFVGNLTGEIFETPETTLYQDFLEKYLGESKFITNFTQSSSITEIYEVPIQVGNNNFFYPFGVIDQSISGLGRLPLVALSSLQIEGATSGTTLENSDTLFVKNGDTIQGAWLRFNEFNERREAVQATIKQNTNTKFIFPFAGYGLSGIDFEWTGNDFETTIQYDFLSNELKTSINNQYWSQVLPSDSIDEILLNNTTLVSSGATPNKKLSFADQVTINKERVEDSTVPAGSAEGAWLFRFEKTALPISSNEENVLLWPYQIVDIEEDYPQHLKDLNFEGICQSISIQDLNRSFFIASSSIEGADKIYKLNSFADEIEQATECCWLSGRTLTLSSFKMFSQEGFSVLFPVGQATRFVWQGSSVPISEVFSSVEHRRDCPFVTNVPPVSTLEWQKCSCKQVYYSPFGHYARTFEENNRFADCIIKDVSKGTDQFDFGSWKDSTGNGVVGSKEVCWYQTNSEISWGEGRWISNNLAEPSPFNLEPGQAYFYRRVDSKFEPGNMPPYSVNYKFANPQPNKWINAKINDENKTWISSEQQSQMVLRPGDFVKYQRLAQTQYYLISSQPVENVSTNKGSLWASSDVVALNSPSSTTNISWPFVSGPFLTDNYGNQSPPTTVQSISAIIAWRIQCDQKPSLADTLVSPFTYSEQISTLTYQNIFTFTFVPPQTGTYSISVTAVDNQQTYYFLNSTTIPKLTVVPQFRDQEVLIEANSPSNGFLIEHPLKGWNYNSSRRDPNANGARPYWASLLSEKESSTRFKGIYAWGYPDEYVDGYLPNSNPIISNLTLSYGSVVDYKRYGTTFAWNQPIAYKEFDGTTTWCTLCSDLTKFSNLSSLYETKQEQDLIVIPMTSATNITLTNIKNGLPVEIFYYSLNSFVWNISVEVEQEIDPIIPELFLESPQPWGNLSNRFYGTIATIPVLENLYSEDEVGGYFTSPHLGASQFINKDFQAFLKSETLSGSFLTEDASIHVGGRGLTKEDQETLYDWTEQNQWMKEPPVAGLAAGAVKKSLTKTLQTFTPYQGNIEETSLGLVTPRSRVSPWGGPTAEQWTDTLNEPKSYTGVRNVSAWVDKQILKQNKKIVDNWITDIYGNQYGLFKNLEGVKVSDRPEIGGELWMRVNSQLVQPATESLSAIFDLLREQTYYKDLTSGNIKSVDCFMDTLMIETPTAVLFCLLEFDYETSQISTIFDNIAIVDSLSSNSIKFEQTWFFPETKNIVTSFTRISGESFIPEINRLDLDTRAYVKVFPVDQQTTDYILSSLEEIKVKELSKSVLTYNSPRQTYLITYKGVDKSNRLFVVNFKIEQRENLILTKIDKYLDYSDPSLVLDPPVVEEIYSQPYAVQAVAPFSFAIPALNQPTSYQLKDTRFPFLTVDNSGVFSGFINSPGFYDIDYSVSNQIGTSRYSLTLRVV